MPTQDADRDRPSTERLTEPAATPLISVADVDPATYPCERIEDSRLDALDEWAKAVAATTNGSRDDHLTGKLGEWAFAEYVDLPTAPNTEIYADSGDGGVDLSFDGATIDVKTVGEHRSNPVLTVDTYTSLTADYYVLASRVGPTDVRLVGYTPRPFVADAPQMTRHGTDYHLVDQEYLFPFPDR